MSLAQCSFQFWDPYSDCLLLIAPALVVGFTACVTAIPETACLAVLVLWPGAPAAFYRISAPLWLTVLPLLPCLAIPAAFVEQSGVVAWMVLVREKGSLSRTDPWLALVFVIALILARFRALGSRCGAGGQGGRTAVPDPAGAPHDPLEVICRLYPRLAASQSGGRGAQEGCGTRVARIRTHHPRAVHLREPG